MKKYQELKQKVDEFGWVKFLPGDKGQKWSEHSLGHAQDLLDRFSEAVEVQQEKVLEMREIGKLLAAHCTRMEKEVQLFSMISHDNGLLTLRRKTRTRSKFPALTENTETFLESVASVLAKFRFGWLRESMLHEGVGEVLGKEVDACLMSETALSPSDRPDYWFPDQGVAVELKIDGSLSALTRQVHRYALLPQVRGVLVVTPLRRLCGLPETMGGVPVRMAYLESSVF